MMYGMYQYYYFFYHFCRFALDFLNSQLRNEITPNKQTKKKEETKILKKISHQINFKSAYNCELAESKHWIYLH